MDNLKTRDSSVLIVDDHILFREGLTTMLNNQSDFKVVGQAELVCGAEKAMSGTGHHLMEVLFPMAVGPTP
jgi:DNA-binding NarL/FixJ family response regulator